MAQFPEKKGAEHFIEAAYYTKTADKKVTCLLCPKKCELTDGQSGFCLVRKNEQGILYNVIYGRSNEYVYDPKNGITVMPAASFSPHLSIRPRTGCALRCAFCFLGETMQTDPLKSESYYNKVPILSPKNVIEHAKKYNIKMIAFTNNEPVINYEYTLETARLAKAAGLKTILVTGGYANPEPFNDIVKYMDVVSFSLKGFSESAYQRYTTGSLAVVLNNLKSLKNSKTAVEVSYIVIPTISDKDEDISAMAQWVKVNLGEYTPVHFIRYWPSFKLRNLPATPLDTIKQAMLLARNVGLKYVTAYPNINAHSPSELKALIDAGLMKLYCPYCQRLVAEWVMQNEKVVTQTHFGENHVCGWCGKKFLNIVED